MKRTRDSTFGTPRPVTVDDVHDVERLVNSVTRADVGLHVHEPGGLLRAWQEGEPFDRHRIVRSAEGVAGVLWVEADGSEPSLYYELFLDADALGVSSVLIEAAEDQAAELAAVHRTPVEIAVSAGSRAVAEIFESHDYRPLRTHIAMLIDLDDAPEPRWPEGIRPRTYREGPDDQTMYETIRTGFGPDWHEPEDAAGWLNRHRAEAYDPNLWFFAEDASGAVLGAVHSRTAWEGARDTGWVRNLAVLPNGRRRGIGHALLTESFARMKRMGLRRALLGVDEANATGALDLYRSAGMHEGGRSTDLVKEIAPL